MTKRIRSTEQKTKAVQNATKDHPWPDEAGMCLANDWAMYSKLLQQRSHDDWTQSDLISLANLAKLQADLVKEHDKLRLEGLIVLGGKNGTVQIQNPRSRVVHDLNSSINSLARRLGLTSMSVADKRSGANRGKLERRARDVLTPDDDTPARSGRALM